MIQINNRMTPKNTWGENRKIFAGGSPESHPRDKYQVASITREEIDITNDRVPNDQSSKAYLNGLINYTQDELQDTNITPQQKEQFQMMETLFQKSIQYIDGNHPITLTIAEQEYFMQILDNAPLQSIHDNFQNPLFAAYTWVSNNEWAQSGIILEGGATIPTTKNKVKEADRKVPIVVQEYTPKPLINNKQASLASSIYLKGSEAENVKNTYSLPNPNPVSATQPNPGLMPATQEGQISPSSIETKTFTLKDTIYTFEYNATTKVLERKNTNGANTPIPQDNPLYHQVLGKKVDKVVDKTAAPKPAVTVKPAAVTTDPETVTRSPEQIIKDAYAEIKAATTQEAQKEGWGKIAAINTTGLDTLTLARVNNAKAKVPQLSGKKIVKPQKAAKTTTAGIDQQNNSSTINIHENITNNFNIPKKGTHYLSLPESEFTPTQKQNLLQFHKKKYVKKWLNEISKDEPFIIGELGSKLQMAAAWNQHDIGAGIHVSGIDYDAPIQKFIKDKSQKPIRGAIYKNSSSGINLSTVANEVYEQYVAKKIKEKFPTLGHFEEHPAVQIPNLGIDAVFIDNPNKYTSWQEKAEEINKYSNFQDTTSGYTALILQEYKTDDDKILPNGDAILSDNTNLQNTIGQLLLSKIADIKNTTTDNIPLKIVFKNIQGIPMPIFEVTS